jgi:hypothetical protein
VHRLINDSFPKVGATPADKARMEPKNLQLPDPHDVIEAAGEMMEAMCKLRGISVEDLTEAEVDAAMVMAFQSN